MSTKSANRKILSVPSGVKMENKTKSSQKLSKKTTDDNNFSNAVVNVEEGEKEGNKSSVNETKVGRKYFQVKSKNVNFKVGS